MKERSAIFQRKFTFPQLNQLPLTDRFRHIKTYSCVNTDLTRVAVDNNVMKVKIEANQSLNLPCTDKFVFIKQSRRLRFSRMRALLLLSPTLQKCQGRKQEGCFQRKYL